MKRIHIISHCWCPPGTNEYAQTLKWQLTSLIQHRPPDLRVNATICCNPEDTTTIRVLREIDKFNFRTGLEFVAYQLHKPQLFTRAYGRNLVAQESDCSIVWFCDCDYVFGEGCLEAVADQVVEDDVLYYPGEQLITEGHELGARILLDNLDTSLPEIDPAQYVPKRIRKAIGGLQIVTGNTARKGYLDDTKWTRPVDEAGGFRNTKCDMAYRKTIPRSQKIHVPNLYRMRHQVTGLFLDLQGNPQG